MPIPAGFEPDNDRRRALTDACEAICHGCKLGWELRERLDGGLHWEHVVPEARRVAEGYGTRYSCAAAGIRRLMW